MDPPEEDEDNEDTDGVVTSYRIPLRHPNEVTNVIASDPVLSRRFEDWCYLLKHTEKSSKKWDFIERIQMMESLSLNEKNYTRVDLPYKNRLTILCHNK